MSTHVSTPRVAVIACAALVAACSPQAVHKSLHPPHGDAKHIDSNTRATAPEPTTYRLADDGSNWKRSPQMHAYYDATVAAFSQGSNIDVDAYEAKSFAIFREFARANHVPEQAMLDHLKLIPRQVVGIVKENPAVLKSYDSFWTALVGPD